MITEDYVSFEIAKLLKEKGFDWYTYDYYEDEDNPNISLRASKAINWNKTEFISKPTLQMAMKWLREAYNLCIEPYRTACGYLYTISTIPYGSCKCNPNECGDDEDSGQWTTYEGACEAAIKYCFEKLIQ